MWWESSAQEVPGHGEGWHGHDGTNPYATRAMPTRGQPGSRAPAPVPTPPQQRGSGGICTAAQHQGGDDMGDDGL